MILYISTFIHLPVYEHYNCQVSITSWKNLVLNLKLMSIVNFGMSEMKLRAKFYVGFGTCVDSSLSVQACTDPLSMLSRSTVWPGSREITQVHV